jgi:hypothetical protein
VKEEACVVDKVDGEIATAATHAEELAATLDEELAATHDEEFAAATALSATKNHVNVELAEKDHIVKDIKTAQNAKSKPAINTLVHS